MDGGKAFDYHEVSNHPKAEVAILDYPAEISRPIRRRVYGVNDTLPAV